MVSDVFCHVPRNSLCHIQALHSNVIARIYCLKTMRGRLGMRRTCQTKCDRSRCHVVCFGSRLSVVRDFVAREDLERLQLRRPTCLQAPQNRGSFQKEHVTHSLLFFESYRHCFWESDGQGVSVGRPRSLDVRACGSC